MQTVGHVFFQQRSWWSARIISHPIIIIIIIINNKRWGAQFWWGFSPPRLSQRNFSQLRKVELGEKTCPFPAQHKMVGTQKMSGSWAYNDVGGGGLGGRRGKQQRQGWKFQACPATSRPLPRPHAIPTNSRHLHASIADCGERDLGRNGLCDGSTSQGPRLHPNHPCALAKKRQWEFGEWSWWGWGQILAGGKRLEGGELHPFPNSLPKPFEKLLARTKKPFGWERARGRRGHALPVPWCVLYFELTTKFGHVIRGWRCLQSCGFFQSNDMGGTAWLCKQF